MEIRNSAEYQTLRSLLDDLETRGLVTVTGKGLVGYNPSKRKPKKEDSPRIIGKLIVNKRGFGFVRVEGMDGDIFIGQDSMKTALHGDIVEVVPFARPITKRTRRADDRTEGEIVRIVERAATTIVGTLEHSERFCIVIPDDERITRDIYVDRDNLKGARNGDKVVVGSLVWEDPQRNPEGTVVEVLGASGDARVEVLGVARSFGLPMTFPSGVEQEAEQFSETIPAAEIRKRLDLRETLCFTIDPEDAKDFDDALSFETLPDGRARLGVHIADVSHYVRKDSTLDREALARGTSVYMVNEVIPMLPERLSNNLCSLKPDVDRLSYSVLMDVLSNGKVENYTIRKSVIHSRRRFTYEEVQKILEKGAGEFSDTLLPLLAFTRVLLKQRRQNGSIDFDTGEAKFRFDEHGFPSHIVKKERLDSHRLVEECMLLANRITFVPDLQLVERLELSRIQQELSMSQSEFVDKSTAPRIGKIVGAAKIVTGTVTEPETGQLSLDCGIIDVGPGLAEYPRKQQGKSSDFFDMQKKLSLDIIAKLGYKVTPEIKNHVDKSPTESMLAFIAYSLGLEYADQGHYALADAEFKSAVAEDPNFSLAKQALGRYGGLSGYDGNLKPISTATGLVNEGVDQQALIVERRGEIIKRLQQATRGAAPQQDTPYTTPQATNGKVIVTGRTDR